MMHILRRLGAVALLFGVVCSPVLAQYTTSSISGQVTDDTGVAVPGATVVVVHEPTGTRRETTTQAGGQYRATGLRIGGPYTVTVTADGFSGDRISDVYISLNDAYELNVEVEQGTAQLDTIQVTGTVLASDIYAPDSKGAKTVINRQDIENLPTVTRSLNDYIRLDPRAVVTDEGRGEISVAGQNSRYNNITIDNVPSNDEFGLEAGGVPSRGNVISIDAVDEIQVNVSPYDVSQSNFVGGGINVVTKSGTNDFEGSAYYLYRDEDFINDSPNDFRPFEDETYGFTLGGPIIEDKLFFFVSYEHVEQTEAGADVGLRGSNSSTIFDLPQSDLDRIINISNGTYGFDPGQQAAPTNLVDEDDLFLAKVDWNISNQHRAQFQYKKTEGDNAVIPNRNGSNFSLGSHWYSNNFQQESFVAMLFSDWSPNFSTEVNFSFGSFDKVPSLNGPQLPQVTINTDAGDVVFGTEQFRHANILNTETDTFYAAGEYLMGDHTLKFGVDYKSNDFLNTFVNDSLGVYEFASIDDYANNVVDGYSYRIGSDPNDPFPSADWSYSNIGLFLQDSWDLSYNFSLVYGVRVDVPNVNDDPQFNQSFTDTYGFRNDFTIDGNEVIQPRVGFNWDLSDNYAAQVRGGVGLFQGSSAGVWLSNPFTNPGGTIASFDEGSGNILFTPDVNNQPAPGGVVTGGRQDVDVLSPDFEQPTVWRANLAYDRELPWGVQMTAEVVHSEVENGIHYTSLNLGAPTGVLPDGRFSFYCDPADTGSGNRCNADPDFGDVLLLSNTNKGDSTLYTLEFSKRWMDSLSTNVAYTVGRSNEVNSGTSSRAISNYDNRATYNPNEEVSATANYQIEERIIASLNWRKQLFGRMNTNVGLFYEGRSGRPFSYTFDNDANGDNESDNDLLFIPANPGDVVFTDPAEEQQFFDMVNQNECLRQFRGTVVSRNHCNSEFIHQVDLRVSQEIPLFFDARGEVFFNILNLGNLIDDDWGLIEEVPFEYVAEAVNYRGLTDDGRYIYDLSRSNFDFPVDGEAQSRWSVQLGMKIRF